MNDIGNRQQVRGDMQNVDDLLQDLGRVLDVTPSPDFGANVLARVHRPTPSSSLWSWRWASAAGALAAVVVLALATRVNWKSPDTPPRETHADPTVASPAVHPASLMPSAAAPVRHSPPPHRELMTLPARAGRQALNHSRVLTAPDQAVAVRILLDRFARGNVPSRNVVGEEAPASVEINELAPIPLIVIPPLDAPPNNGGAGSRK